MILSRVLNSLLTCGLNLDVDFQSWSTCSTASARAGSMLSIQRRGRPVMPTLLLPLLQSWEQGGGGGGLMGLRLVFAATAITIVSKATTLKN